MTVRLRAHHLLCLLTYAGKGYTPAFTANYDLIAQRISGGEDILIVAGPDDICAPLLDGQEPHCLRERVAERDRHAAAAVADLLARPVSPGSRVTLDADDLRRMRAAFSSGQTRLACEGCEWHGLCSEIARGGYPGVRVQHHFG